MVSITFAHWQRAFTLWDVWAWSKAFKAHNIPAKAPLLLWPGTATMERSPCCERKIRTAHTSHSCSTQLRRREIKINVLASPIRKDGMGPWQQIMNWKGLRVGHILPSCEDNPGQRLKQRENKCLHPNNWLYKWKQPFCVPGDTPCVLCPQPHPSKHLLSHEAETFPHSCRVWSLSNALQEVCTTFSKQLSSAATRTISFTTGKSDPCPGGRAVLSGVSPACTEPTFGSFGFFSSLLRSGWIHAKFEFRLRMFIISYLFTDSCTVSSQKTKIKWSASNSS